MINKFKKFLDKELPNNYNYWHYEANKEIRILSEKECIYLFFENEIEEEFEECCLLVYTLLDLEKLDPKGMTYENY